MRYLLDTNVVSELRKVSFGKANHNVAKWAESVNASDLYLSVVTIQELEIGVLLVERRDPAQGAMLRSWLNDSVLPTFSGRILDIDTLVATNSARLHVPNPQSFQDGLIAATAIVHKMTVATRNVADFESTGALLFNPWADI